MEDTMKKSMITHQDLMEGVRINSNVDSLEKVEAVVKEQKLQQTHSIDEAYKDNEFKKDLEGHISNLIKNVEKS